MYPPSQGSTGKVRVGFFSFTEVTDPAAHRSYNEWHQLDHLPEQLPVPGIAWGQRWVATPACRAARTVENELLAATHYMTLYLMTEPVGETLAAFSDLAVELRRLGRFHHERRSHLSGPFEALHATSAPRVLVSGAAVPYRPGTGAYVVVEAAEPGAHETVLRHAADHDAFMAVDGVAGVWTFASTFSWEPERWQPGTRRITVCFLDGDPLELSGPLGVVATGDPGRARAPGLTVEFAGPFEVVVPGRWDWFDE